MKTKFLAIIAVIIIVVAGLGTYAFLSKDDKNDAVVETDRLLIYGNVNNDDVIDSRDVSLLKEMIDGNKEASDLADVNADGKLNNDDVAYLEKIINKTATTVYYYNAMYQKAYAAPYPINHYVVASPELTMYSILLGLDSKIVGTAKLNDAVLFNCIKDVPNLCTVTKGVQWNVDVVEVSKLSTKADAVVTTIESYAVNTESSFQDAGIPVIRLDIRGTSSISAALMLGFLCGVEKRAEEFVNFIDETQTYINNKLANVKDEDRVTALIVSSTAVYGKDSGFTACIGLAGGKVAIEVDGVSKALGDTEWLNNVKPDYVMGYTTVTSYNYSEANAVTYWGTFTEKYGFFDCVPEDFMFVGYYLPDTIRAAYLVEVFYPELFEKGYGDSVHQTYLDKFIDSLHASGYKVSEKGNFLITQSDIDAIKAKS